MAFAASPSAAPAPLSRHVGETVRLALPIIASRAGLILLVTVDTMMTGWAGADELAYLAVGIAPQLTLMLMAVGGLQATAVLAARAVGAGEGWRAGEVLRTGLVHAFLVGLLIAAGTAFAEELFLHLGQPPAIAGGAARVSMAFAYGLPGLLMYIVAGMFLEATGRPAVPTAIILAANVVNVPLNAVLVLGYGGVVPPMGAEGAVIGSSMLRTAAFFAAFAAILATPGGDRFGVRAPLSAWLSCTARLGGEVGVRLRRLGVPMSLAQGVESSAFATVVFLAGSIGAAAAAAHQTTMTLVILVFMAAIGFGGAAAIRVSAAVGRRAPVDVRRAGFTAIALAALVSLPFSALYFFVPETMVRLVTDDPAVVAVATVTLSFVALFLVFDAANGVTAGALRGLGDVWLPLYIQAAAFWLVAVPIAWWIGLVQGGGPFGLIVGIALGMVASALLLIWRFRTVARRPLRPT